MRHYPQYAIYRSDLAVQVPKSLSPHKQRAEARRLAIAQFWDGDAHVAAVYTGGAQAEANGYWELKTYRSELHTAPADTLPPETDQAFYTATVYALTPVYEAEQDVAFYEPYDLSDLTFARWGA